MGFRVLALLLVLVSASASAQPEPKRILLLNSYRSALPANREFEEMIREQLDLPPMVAVEFNTDTLNLAMDHDDNFVQNLLEVYQVKYHASPPDLVIATFGPAVQFVLDHRDELFPGIPIILCFTEYVGDDLEQLPPNVTTVTTRLDYSGTVELMSRLHPDMRRIVLIVGSSHVDALREQEASKALQQFESRFEFTWLQGIPLSQLTETVRALPPHTVILYVFQNVDRNGISYVSPSFVEAVSGAANVPVYGLWDTLIGSGMVGGRLMSIERQGVEAGKIARRILLGEVPAAVPDVRLERNDVIVDARQLQRWSIDERLLPEGSRILNRERSLWEQHRNVILIAGSLIALQALWIAVLLRNRSKLQRAQGSLRQEYDHRIQADELIRRLRTRLSAEEKQSNLGALAGRIAHEINQPLISIKNYAQAAMRYIPNDSAKEGKLAELVAEMEGEANRAGSIIQKIRTLLSSERVDAVPVDLDSVLKEVVAVMKPEADAHGRHINYRVSAPVPIVVADALQVQLVMVNLLRNAMQAAASHDLNINEPVSITVGETADRMVQVSVADTGPGVPADETENIFESLYSTKEAGMGVGLATCRTIIEAHGGSIWCTQNPVGGAIFHFTIPIAEGGA